MKYRVLAFFILVLVVGAYFIGAFSGVALLIALGLVLAAVFNARVGRSKKSRAVLCFSTEASPVWAPVSGAGGGKG